MKTRSKNLRACLRSFFLSHFSDILSEKSEERRGVALPTPRRSEDFAAKIAQNGVGRRDREQPLSGVHGLATGLTFDPFFGIIFK